MNRWNTLLAASSVLVLAGCQSEEVTRLCAASGDAAVGLTVFAHDASGQVVRLTSDATETRIAVTQLDTPIVGDLWLDAELTFQATLRGEISPCEGTQVTYVTAAFTDDEPQERATQCTGNALARLAGRVIETSSAAIAARPEAAVLEDLLPETPESAGQACAWAYEQL